MSPSQAFSERSRPYKNSAVLHLGSTLRKDPGGRRLLPEREEARKRAQATVDSARDQYTGPAQMSGGARSISVEVSSETWAALETIAQGRTLEALIAEAIENYVRKNSTPPPPA